MLQQLQFYEAAVLAIPRGTPKKEMALDYLRYATGSAPLPAGMTRLRPSRRRAFVLPLVEEAAAIADARFRAVAEGRAGQVLRRRQQLVA